MSADGGTGRMRVTPPLPRSIWVVAWGSLAGQAVWLLRHGRRFDDEVSLFLSVGLGALVVGLVAAGVARARTVRLVIAWVVLVLGGLAELAALPAVDDVGDAVLAALSLATTITVLAALASFHRSDWYVWQRTGPSTRAGASISGLVVIGVLVGVLGGITAQADEGLQLRFGAATN